jgi:hypothetical protein
MGHSLAVSGAATPSPKGQYATAAVTGAHMSSGKDSSRFGAR